MTMHESTDGRILKWSGLAIGLFLFGALISLGHSAGDVATAAAEDATRAATTTAPPG
jgi:hypothetical protein